jgi:hypothetical protein
MKFLTTVVFITLLFLVFTIRVHAQAAPTRLVSGPGMSPQGRMGDELILGAAGIPYDSGIQTITTTPTVLTSLTTRTQIIFCENHTGGTVTVTITDNQGSPMTYYGAIAIPANTATMLQATAIGLPMKGIKWSVGANASINCQVTGVQ